MVAEVQTATSKLYVKVEQSIVILLLKLVYPTLTKKKREKPSVY